MKPSLVKIYKQLLTYSGVKSESSVTLDVKVY